MRIDSTIASAEQDRKYSFRHLLLYSDINLMIVMTCAVDFVYSPVVGSVKAHKSLSRVVNRESYQMNQ